MSGAPVGGCTLGIGYSHLAILGQLGVAAFGVAFGQEICLRMLSRKRWRPFTVLQVGRTIGGIIFNACRLLHCRIRRRVLLLVQPLGAAGMWLFLKPPKQNPQTRLLKQAREMIGCDRGGFTGVWRIVDLHWAKG